MIPAFVAAGLLFVAAPSPPALPSASPGQTVAGGSLSFFGGDFTIPADEIREGNVTIYGGSGDIEGTITHDLRVFGGSVRVNGRIGHDLIMFGGSVDLGPQADIGHDVTVVGGSVSRDPGARIGHDYIEGGFSSGVLASLLPAPPELPRLAEVDTAFRVSLSVGLVLLALLLQLLFPRQIATARDALDERPFASLGLGCLTAAAGVLLAALLAITVILLPASLAIVAGIVAGWLLGLAGVVVLIGQRLTTALHVRIDPIPTLLIGGVLVAVLVNVPYFGLVFALLIGSMALGAVVLTRFGTRPHPPATPPLPAAPTEAPR